MPNVKIFVDEALYPSVREQLAKTLGPVRDMLCHDLSVEVPACQFAVLASSACAVRLGRWYMKCH